jgi:hypothetical protein
MGGRAIMAMVLLVTLVAGWLVVGRGRQEPGGPGGRERPAGPVLGVYHGAGNLAEVGEFERWLGRDLGALLDFLPGGSWEDIEGSTWLFRRWSSAGRTLVLTVPMLPGPWDRSHDGGVSLRACSVGAYDEHWKRLAGNLVAHRLGGTILRPGHEFNAGWYAWGAAGEERDFAGCFRRVVESVRGVPGGAFTFVWNPALGRLDADPLLAYPGDEYVDSIGVDVYDQSWQPGTYPIPRGASPNEVRERRQRAWSGMLHGDLGLEFWSRWARSRGKSLSIPEWGLTYRPDGHGGGDNSFFVEQIFRFVNEPANRVSQHIYFEHDARDGEHRLTGGRFSAAASSFRTYFGDLR